MSLKVRSLWLACSDPETHDLCEGKAGNTECICWHHIEQARNIAHAAELFDEIFDELRYITELSR